MQSLTVKEVIKELQRKNPDAPVLFIGTGGIARPAEQIDNVPINGNDLPAILIS